MSIIYFLIIIGIITLIKTIFRPEFDYTRDKKLLLWYGRRNNRKYIIIFQ